MSKLMTIILIIITLAIALCFGFIYLLTGDPLARWSSSNIIQSDKTIEKIKFTVNEDPGSDRANLTVYLYSGNRTSKLANGDILTLNNQIIKSEYYNNGTASGFKYISEIPKAEEYILSIKRAGHEEIKKSIKTEPLTFDIPNKISKSENLTISYTSKTPLSNRNVDGPNPTIIFSSAIEDSVRMSDKNIITTSGGGEIFIDSKEIIIEATKLTLEKDKFDNLKNGRVNLFAGVIFEQKDGDLVIGNKKVVEIVD